MKKRLFFGIQFLVTCLTFGVVVASGDLHTNNDPLQKTFFSKPYIRDYDYQQTLMQQSFWQNFVNQNGEWKVMFNESSGMPHRAYGKPIAVGGGDIKSVSDNFMASQLHDLLIRVSELQFVSVVSNAKYHYVNYKQYYQGLEILMSRVQVKMTHNYLVNQFALDCYNDINLSISPSINEQQAIQFATAGVYGVVNVKLSQMLKVLPVPTNRNYNFHLVYEVMIENSDMENIPGKYYTLIDANTGEILYRDNLIRHFAGGDLDVKGTLYTSHPYNPSTVEPLKNLKVVQSGIDYFTDGNGYLNLNNTSITSANFSLEGRYVSVQTNGIIPAWSMFLGTGTTNVSADNDSDIKQRTTYHAIDRVHEYMKTKYPAFTDLDWPMPANIDVPGTCNAYYDGGSVNFFAQGGGCNATSLVQDVCFHEYGHGINDWFYQSLGYSFDNGAMHEGYADLWALGITGSPILGIGFFSTSATGFIRRYDINKKIYPQNLVGEVHADGEIIAGCFWDTGLNLGNLQQMMDLFKETYYAGITGFNGDEGNIFPDILLETLMQDDNDGDISNGTPNYCAILAAFETHGITISNPLPCAPIANFTYAPAVICAGNSVTFHNTSSFSGTLDWSFPGGVPSTSSDANPVVVYPSDGFYDVSLTVTNGVGSNNKTLSSIINVKPGFGQNAIPFYESFENITFPGTDWSVVNDGGNSWEQNVLAAKTGTNSIYIDNINGNVEGTTDVFYTPSYNFTGLSGAIMTFELAFAQKDSSNADRLKVFASANCGLLWNIRYVKIGAALASSASTTSPFIPSPVEWNTQTVNLNSVTYNNKPNVMFRFEYLHDGGNNIFVDDINISGVVGLSEAFQQSVNLSVHPNPVGENAGISFVLDNAAGVRLDIVDVLGRVVNTITESNLEAGEYEFKLPSDLSNGLYNVILNLDNNSISKKFLVNR